MGSSRERGFSVTPERLAFIEQKMREMGIDSRGALPEATTLSQDVIYKKLFSGRNIDRNTVEAIAKTLKIQPTEIIEPERWYRRSKTAKSQASTNIDWHYVCRTMLDRQKKLSTNEVIASEAMQFDLLDDEIFISLALVERKEPERLSQNVHPARPIEQYEEKPPIEYEQFREQILRQGKSDRIAIVGEPGAGKTTLLQHIAFWILDKDLGLPIWISLADLIKNGDLQRLKDYLTQVWLDDAVPNVTQDVKSDFLKQLNEQRVWLLLDGADEIVASSGIALREINNQLRGWLSQSCIILTCRINVWEVDINALRDFQTYRTKQFHYPTQVERFIESGFRKSNQQSGKRLKTELASTERTRLQQLVRNPLRLMMLCTTWHEQESLPATKAELYERFVREFYKWNRSKWKKKDLNYAFFPNTVAKEEKLNKTLGRLACRVLDEELSPFRLPHNLVSDELGDPDEDGSNFWLALNLGWLQVARDSDKPSEKVYTFFHPTFQEYFASSAIDDWRFFLNHNNSKPNPFLSWNGKDCTYRVFQAKWREIILFWLGQENREEEKERFITDLVEFEDGCENFYYDTAYLSAAYCILEYPKSRHTSEILESFIWSSCWFRGKQEIKGKSSRLAISPVEAQQFLKEVKHEQSIKVLIKILTSLLIKLKKAQGSQDKNAFYKQLHMAELLSEITIQNQEVIEVINKLTPNLDSSQNHSPLLIIPGLRRMAERYPEAINVLAIICKEEDNSLTREMAYSGLLENENLFNIKDVVKQIDSCQNNSFLKVSLLISLYKRDPNNEAIINNLVHLIFCLDGDTFHLLDWFSEREEIIQHPKIISTLLKILDSDDDDQNSEDVHKFCALYLGMAKVNSQNVISLLLNIQDNPWDEYRQFQATKILFELSEIDKADFSATLFDFLLEFSNGVALGEVAECLSEMHPDDWAIADTLIDRILDPNWEDEVEWFFPSLEKVIRGQLLPIAVKNLREYLVSTSSTAKWEAHEYINHLLRRCAQNMSYPDFYRAWHSSPFSDTQLLRE